MIKNSNTDRKKMRKPKVASRGESAKARSPQKLIPGQQKELVPPSGRRLESYSRKYKRDGIIEIRMGWGRKRLRKRENAERERDRKAERGRWS